MALSRAHAAFAVEPRSARCHSSVRWRPSSSGDGRLEAEHATGLREVRHAVLDVLVVAAHRLERDLAGAQRALDPHRGLDLAGQLDDLDRLVVADVDDLAGALRPGQRAHDAVDGVAHEGERAGLAAVAVQLHLAPVEQVLEEDRQRAAPPRRVVARAVGVEEAQDRDLQPVLLGHPQREVLVVVLGRGVGPAADRRRAEHDRVVLGERRRRLAVDVRRGGEHHVRAGLAAQIERDVRAVDVHVQGLERPAEAGDLQRGEVGDRVAAAHRLAHPRGVAAVELLEREVRVLEQAVEVAQRPHREVVDADHGAALVQQALDEVGADEAGGAGHADRLGQGHGVGLLAVQRHAASRRGSGAGSRSWRPATTRSATPRIACPCTMSG